MDKEVVYITSKQELKETLREVLAEESGKNHQTDFENEKLTRSEAQKLVGVSTPTFLKMIIADIFPEHGFGRKKFYMKSEIIEVLRKSANQKR